MGGFTLRRVNASGSPSAVWRSYRITSLFVSLVVELFWNALWLRNQPPEVAEQRWQAVYHRQALRFRRVAEEMGGILIKVGQFLSSRVDLLPKPYIDELAKLQDRVPASPWSRVQPVLVAELGPLTHHFHHITTTPIASASFGQVYEAWLLDGTKVAVKVQHPGIAEVVEADLKALGWIVGLTTWATQFGRTFDLYTVLREFRKMVYEELDYAQELRNMDTIRQELKDMPEVVVPQAYPRLCTPRVLVMEYWNGIKIDHVEALTAHGLSRHHVAERVIRVYLHMVFEAGVYHADPHAGNILVDTRGRLILLDYGMVGSLDAATKHNIRKLFIAVSQRDPQGLVNAMAALGMIRPDQDLAPLRKRVAYLLDRYYAETLNQLHGLDISALLRDFEDLLQHQSIQVPGHFAFLGRAVAILVGLATLLDPDINLIDLFAPYARRFIVEDAGGTTGYVLHQGQDWLKTLVGLPTLASDVFTRLNQGELETTVRWDAGRERLTVLARGLADLTQALYVVGFAVAGALTLDAHQPTWAHVFFGLAVLSGLWGWRAKRRRK
jgi:predicted unusual protein kinase regulating ubiquinone biosynthesis (AarF/ABC1/UbiB family)